MTLRSICALSGSDIDGATDIVQQTSPSGDRATLPPPICCCDWRKVRGRRRLHWNLAFRRSKKRLSRSNFVRRPSDSTWIRPAYFWRIWIDNSYCWSARRRRISMGSSLSVSRIYRRQFGHLPRRLVRWRCEYTKAIHRLLRRAQEQWPPPSSRRYQTFSSFRPT